LIDWELKGEKTLAELAQFDVHASEFTSMAFTSVLHREKVAIRPTSTNRFSQRHETGRRST